MRGLSQDKGWPSFCLLTGRRRAPVTVSSSGERAIRRNLLVMFSFSFDKACPTGGHKQNVG